MFQVAVTIANLYLVFHQNVAEQKPSRSSIGFLAHLDPWFVDWTSRLVSQGPQLDGRHWALECPRPLRGCCPRPKLLDKEDYVELRRLTDLTPASAFAYVLFRRIAELSAQFAVTWTGLVVWSLVIAIWLLKMITWGRSSENCAQYRTQKRVVVVVCVLLLFLIEVALGGDRRRTAPHSSFFGGFSFRRQGYVAAPISVLDLLFPSSLHRTLYALEQPEGGICSGKRNVLAWWSVLISVCALYVAAVSLINVIIEGFWPSALNPSPGGNTDPDISISEMCRGSQKEEPGSQIMSELLFNKEERGSQIMSEALFQKEERGSRIAPEPLFQKEERGFRIVSPQYISRGTYACLDDGDIE